MSQDPKPNDFIKITTESGAVLAAKVHSVQQPKTVTSFKKGDIIWLNGHLTHITNTLPVDTDNVRHATPDEVLLYRKYGEAGLRLRDEIAMAIIPWIGGSPGYYNSNAYRCADDMLSRRFDTSHLTKNTETGELL